MQIFDYLNDIISEKSGKLLQDVESEKEFLPYLVQRWLSMYSNNFSILLNNSTNILWSVMEDKQMWNKMFIGIIPKNKKKIIRYIKKSKKETNKIDDSVVKFICDKYEISKREAIDYYLTDDKIVKQIKKMIG